MFEEFKLKMKAATTPDLVVEACKPFGITEQEVDERFKKAPNFGQFKMTLTNRVIPIIKRLMKNPKLNVEELAYPVKIPKIDKPKKTVTNAGTRPIGDVLYDPFTEEEAKHHAHIFSCTLKAEKEFGSEKAAVAYLRKLTHKEHLVVRGEGVNEGKFVIARMVFDPSRIQPARRNNEPH